MRSGDMSCQMFIFHSPLIVKIFIKHTVLYIIEFLRKVNIIFVGIFKTLYFIPECVYLLIAVLLYILNIGTVVAAFSAVKNLYKKGLCYIIGNNLTLPGVIGVEKLIRLAVVNFFIKKCDNVGNCLARFPKSRVSFANSTISVNLAISDG